MWGLIFSLLLSFLTNVTVTVHVQTLAVFDGIQMVAQEVPPAPPLEVPCPITEADEESLHLPVALAGVPLVLNETVIFPPQSLPFFSLDRGILRPPEFFCV
jgi:hypothetical protein